MLYPYEKWIYLAMFREEQLMEILPIEDAKKSRSLTGSDEVVTS
jgi:hypothetical protein